MKYVITMTASAEAVRAALKMEKEVSEMIEMLKPEAIYFSTIRRMMFAVVNIEDPHVELRKAFEALSRFGEVTIDPVSSLEEFIRFVKQQ